MTTLALIEGLGSPIHWLIVGLIALLLFGRRLPEVGRGLGKGISEFKKGLKDVTDDSNAPSNSTQDPYGPSNTQRYQESSPRQMPPPPAPQRMEHPSASGGGVKVNRRDMVD